MASFFTQCKSRRKRAPKPLPLATILRIGAALGILLIFGLAHLGLRFQLHQTQLETNRMQVAQSKLTSAIKALRAETEALKQPEALVSYARGELNMDYYVTSERETIRMPAEIHTRYAMARTALEDRQLAAGRSELERQGEMWLGIVSERIGFVNTAVAGEPQPEAKQAETPAQPAPVEKKAEKASSKARAN